MTAKLGLLAMVMVGCEGDIDAMIAGEQSSDEARPSSGDGSSDSDSTDTPDDDSNSGDGASDQPDGAVDDTESSVDELGTLTGLEMELTYESTLDGDLVCSKALSITGTPFTGACDDCTFAFAIESTVTADESAPGCSVPAYQLLDTSGTLFDVVFGHSTRLDIGSGGTAASYADAAFVRYSVDGSFGTYGPYTRVLASGDGFEDLGEFLLDGDAFEWGLDQDSFTDGDDVLVDFCEPSYTSSWTDFALSGGYTSASDSVSCDGSQVDLWSIEVETASTVGLGVDTVAADTAFDAKLTLMGSDDCVVATADDNTPCTFAPDRYECPAIELELEPGMYTVMVHSMIDVCRPGVEMGEYTLTVDGSTPIRPSLEDDDIFRYERIPSTVDYRAEGRLLAE